jgi:hypothetical protein
VGVGVGRGGEVESLVDVAQEQLGEGFRDWCGWVAALGERWNEKFRLDKIVC